jgi:hypothetical protein
MFLCLPKTKFKQILKHLKSKGVVMIKCRFLNMVKMNSIFRNRYSPRAYKQYELSDETITTLFEAARWAPSAYNSQPWRFIYATKNMKERWDKLL